MVEKVKNLEKILCGLTEHEIREKIELLSPIKVGTVIRSRLNIEGRGETLVLSKVKEMKMNEDGDLCARYSVIEFSEKKIEFTEEMIFSPLELLLSDEEVKVISHDEWEKVISAFCIEK